MSELFPYCDAKVPELYRFTVCDKERFASSSTRVQKVLDGEEVGIGDVGDVYKVDQVCAVTDNKGSFSSCYTAVECWYNTRVIWTKDRCGPEGACLEIEAI